MTQSGGELLATANETLTNTLALSGTSTIAAARGRRFTLNGSDTSVAGGATLVFGAAGQGRNRSRLREESESDVADPAIEVEDGPLKGGNGEFGDFLAGSPIGVATGATLDLAGDSTEAAELSGGGSITNSGAAAALTFDAGDFSGVISGALSLVANGTVALSGNNTYTGTAKSIRARVSSSV